MANFNEDGLKKKLDDLNMSQQSIQTVSLWLIHHKKHAHTVVNVWYRELITATDSRKLTFMYLANDVIQNSKKKGPEYNKEFGSKLGKVFEHLGALRLDEKSLRGLNRLLNVWEDRSVFDADHIKLFKKNLNSPILFGEEIAPRDVIKEKKEKRGRKEREGKKKEKKRRGRDKDKGHGKSKENNSRKRELGGKHDNPQSKKRRDSASDAIQPSTPESRLRRDSEGDLTQFAVSPQSSTPPSDPPEPEQLIEAIQELENAATSDALVREKIANLPDEVSDVNLLNKLQDLAAGRALCDQVEEALSMLEAYNKRLAEEMEARKAVARMLHDYIAFQKDLLAQAEETLEEHRQKQGKVKKVREELKAHLQNLPDISKLPSIRMGGLAPLPSAGDLFT
ncbi:regulation of nuclear pre-mRNA domain-containing protein 1A-like isoform X1 [Homarus americanus]|uniref:regulation of nuclear pre-mRNA domain-containing protein 1A-like isoform X1 n=1 Tax=Homarus americanus TaxID=6706 RepID=UPI001C47E9CF|nr:regulation of nuclear pre-mRNA domain-containing protein 1A-like isoform X1 [Homarus americanus]